MQLSEFTSTLEHMAKHTKEWACRRRPRDIAPLILLTRGDDPIALVTVDEHVRDTILDVASIACGGFDADQVGIAFEGYLASDGPIPEQTLDPRTGKMWAPGAMQDAVNNDGALEKGWVTEAVTLLTVNRAGDCMSGALPFRFVGKNLVWKERSPSGMTVSGGSTISGDSVARGVMTRSLVIAMTRKSVSQFLPADFPLDREGRDAATEEYLSAQGHAVILLATASDERDQRLRRMGYRNM